MRQIILDTETTGLSPLEGHRIIEIGCLEMIDRKLTGERFHIYMNPEREIDAGAVAVHGITNHFLKDKPLFASIAKQFVDFVEGAELVIHNAPFDVSFLNSELSLTRQGYGTIQEYCSVLDTLPLARKIHVGQRNSLDALCKRYKVDISKRELHGALLDANLLAQVYLAMTGGQGSFFDAQESNATQAQTSHHSSQPLERLHALAVISVNASELLEHQNYLEKLKQQGKCLWDDEAITV